MTNTARETFPKFNLHVDGDFRFRTDSMNGIVWYMTNFCGVKMSEIFLAGDRSGNYAYEAKDGTHFAITFDPCDEPHPHDPR